MLVEELIKDWVLDWTETSLKTHRFIGIFVRHTAIKTIFSNGSNWLLNDYESKQVCEMRLLTEKLMNSPAISSNYEKKIRLRFVGKIKMFLFFQVPV